jgi:outer membrane protein insertion porin family
LFDRPLQTGFTVYSSRYNFDQAQQYAILTGQKLSQLQAQFGPNTLNALQNYTQSSTGFTTSVSYPLRHSLKRVGITYTLDRSSIHTFSDASRDLFQFLYFRQTAGPNALTGILTSKVTPNLSFNTLDRYYGPHSGKSLFLAADIAGLGGNVRYVRPVMDWKQFIPMKIFKPEMKDKAAGHQVLGYHVMASFLSGYGGLVASPFERFYQGGDNDLRGFDIRSISPIAYIADTVSFPLLNPDQTAVPSNPANPRSPAITVPIPIYRIVFPGGDLNLVGNVEYRIPIIGNTVTLAIFDDVGVDPIIRNSQLHLTPSQLTTLNTTPYGCPVLSYATGCSGAQNIPFSGNLKTLGGTNWQPRMSTGVELQVMMPVINAPFRLYYAYNPLRLDQLGTSPNVLTRNLFPPGAIGDYSFAQASALYSPTYMLREPRKTFRFTVSTTF